MPEQLTGFESVARAIDEMAAGGESVSVLMYLEGSDNPEVESVAEKARVLGVECIQATSNDMARMAVGHSPSDEPPSLLAMRGREVGGDLLDAFARGGIVWLLFEPKYTGNVGFSIRTAEVSGATAVVVDAEMTHDERRSVERQSVRATRYIPTFWEDSRLVVKMAKDCGYRVVCIEDVGNVEPWEADLAGDVLCVVGSERDGIPEWLLSQADLVVRLPMDGFVPSYNLQVAVSVVALESLRQRLSQG